ncbi:hypothetical protein DFH09DRAFT_1397058, partial [Mycena vulgaris]
MNEFPAEIVEQVIDSLVSNASSIAACGLVCKQWNPRSRFHLFAAPLDLHIGALPGFKQGRTEADIVALKALANSPLQTFATFIRALNIMGPLPEIYLVLKDLAPLANVASLTIECTGRRLMIPPNLAPVLRALSASFPRVRALQLVGGEFTLAQAAAVACGFGALESLRLDPVRWVLEDTKRAAIAEALPHGVRALKLGGGTGYYAVLPWLIAHQAPPTLDTLCLETASISAADFARLRDLLRVLGPSLRTLSLFFLTRDADAWWSKTKAVYITQHLTLAYNTGLRALSFGADPKNGTAICSALLTQLVPTLCAPELQSVSVLVLHDLHVEDEAVVRECLPQCVARGIVFFQQYGEVIKLPIDYRVGLIDNALSPPPLRG